MGCFISDRAVVCCLLSVDRCMPTPSIDSKTCVIRDTAHYGGRTRTVTPETSATRQLHYGRIILAAADAPLGVDPGSHETGLIALNGSGAVIVGTTCYEMVPYDALYLPSHTRFEVTA